MGKKLIHMLFGAAIILIPLCITLALNGDISIQEKKVGQSGRYILYRTDAYTERMDIEQYLIGLLAAYLPAEYEAETAKCMAVLFRTSIYRSFLKAGEDVTELKEEEIKLSSYSLEQMKNLWKEDFTNQYEKLQKAVADTRGEILLYEGVPIEPFFHAVSAGRTRGLEDYPYLRSADSGQDIKADEFLRMITISWEDIVSKIKETEGTEIVIREDMEDSLRLTSADGLYVDIVSMDMETGEILSMSAERFAEIFNLSSTAFSIEPYHDKCRIISKGKGSGLGLSLYGANQMALDGSDYRNIIVTYYQIEFDSYE